MSFKKGDRVRYSAQDNLGTVIHDQVPYNTVVGVQWDNGTTTTTNENYLILVERAVVSVPKECRYKKGDRVRFKKNGVEGSVVDDQSVFGNVIQVRLNNSMVLDTHTSGVERVPLVEKAEAGFLYKKGDRVRLKYNKNGGTIQEDQTSTNTHVWVLWDHRSESLIEKPEDLVALHTPRETDEPHPMQSAIDAIEVERTKLKKQVEDLQFKLGRLTQAKKILEKEF